MRISTLQYAILLAKQNASKPNAQSDTCPDGDELKRLHKFVIAECERRGWHCSYSDPSRKATRIPPGTEDFHILAPEGRVIRIECKSGNRELDPDQQRYHWTAKGLGHVVHVCRSEREILEVMG